VLERGQKKLFSENQKINRETKTWVKQMGLNSERPKSRPRRGGAHKATGTQKSESNMHFGKRQGFSRLFSTIQNCRASNQTNWSEGIPQKRKLTVKDAGDRLEKS